MSIGPDAIIVGAGVGGVAAALAACEGGARVVLTEQYPWIGGQLTSQAVPPDEHPWIERFGSTHAYRTYRSLVREHYRRNFSLSDRARRSLHLNPGGGSVSVLCHEPRVALSVLQSMLAPHLQAGRLEILTRVRPVAATRRGARLESVRLRHDDGTEFDLSAPLVLDATETGDLLPLASIDYVTGTECRTQTGEPDAPEQAAPQSMQGFTVCFAMDHLEGQDHTIDRPEQYDHWTGPGAPVRDAPQIGWPPRRHDPGTDPPRTLIPNPPVASDDAVVVSASHTGRFSPPPDYKPVEDIWRFRRLSARGNFEPEPASDITLINCSANDYIAGSIIDVPPAVAAQSLHGARQLSLSLLYWLQTQAPRPDGGTGFPGLRLRGDVMGTADGLAMAPYIREGRRILARYTITQNDLAYSVRGDAGAKSYHDSVGVGSYKIDLHPGTGSSARRYDPAWPFEIPLGALLPRETENVLAAAKNIGTTHITNGCYRVHPVEWSIGEAAGALAAFCARRHTTPTHVHESVALLEEFQHELDQRGVERHWPQIRPY